MDGPRRTYSVQRVWMLSIGNATSPETRYQPVVPAGSADGLDQCLQRSRGSIGVRAAVLGNCVVNCSLPSQPSHLGSTQIIS